MFRLRRKPSHGAAVSHEEEEQATLAQLRASLDSLNLSRRAALFCSDECLRRYLCTSDWNLSKALSMLQETIEWRDAYKPEEIKWEDVATEAEKGKIFRADFCDREGRTVLVWRPGAQAQDPNDVDSLIKYLVYSLENAILNLPPGQEQVGWLVDLMGWSMWMTPISLVRETARIVQAHYPERIAYYIIYDPPWFFGTFWNLVKPFFGSRLKQKMKFVHKKDKECGKLMESLFDMERLGCAFGGRNERRFNAHECAQARMQDDMKMASCWQALPSLGHSKSVES